LWDFQLAEKVAFGKQSEAKKMILGKSRLEYEEGQLDWDGSTAGVALKKNRWIGIEGPLEWH